MRLATPTSRFLTPDERARIIRLRREGRTIARIAKLTGRSKRTVTHVTRDLPRKRVMKARTPGRAEQILELLTQGLSQPEVAQHLKLSVTQVCNCVNRHELRANLDLTPLPQLAAELGVSAHAMRKWVAAGKIEATPFGQRCVFTSAQVDEVRRYVASLGGSADDTAHWLDSLRAARELGISRDTLLIWMRDGDPRVSGIRRERVLGMSGNVWRYEPRGVLAAARKLNRAALPIRYHGYVLAKQLAALVDVTPEAVRTWAALGCPHKRDRFNFAGRLWFDLAETVAWLERQSHHRYQKRAALLWAHLAEGKAA